MASGRRTFFSFHYGRDVWRASNVRKAGIVDASARAGWNDASLWERAKLKGDPVIRQMIAKALLGTSVTVVLIGTETASRPWVRYEIAKSIERGNGLLGVRIHSIKDQHGKRDFWAGSTPKLLSEHGAPVVGWNRERFGAQVERVAVKAGKACLPHAKDNCFQCRWISWWA